jgi:hypothetical protein
MSTKELIDYAFEGFDHEAGHAVVRAYIRMPLVSVTIEFVEGSLQAIHATSTAPPARCRSLLLDNVVADEHDISGRAKRPRIINRNGVVSTTDRISVINVTQRNCRRDLYEP